MSSSSYVGGVGSGPARDYSHYYILPAAPAQRQLWLLCQLEPAANAAYNVVSAVRLTGKLDTVRLQRALNYVAARHESLRTGVGMVSGEPCQLVISETLVSMPVVELGGMDHDERVRQLAQELAGLPFTLDEPPLMRVTLVRAGAESHTLIVVIHHVACDGWSTEIFYRDLAETYRAGGPMPDLPVQYADYVTWQAESLAGDRQRELDEHWLKELAGVTPLDLPTDSSRGADRRAAGARLSSTVDAVDELAARLDVTPFMLLLAVFKLTLARVTGQSDIAVGTPVAGRHHPDAEHMIGFFAATLVLRTKLKMTESFTELVAAVRETCLKAFSHQQMPFDRLVEQLRLPRLPGRNPVFDVMFSMQNTPGVTLELPGLRLSPVEVPATAAKFDFWLTVLPEEDGLRLCLDYDRDLYREDTAQRLLDLYTAVLDQIRHTPETKAQVIPREWFCRLEPAKPLTSGERVAVREGGTTLTFGELRAQAAALATRLRQEGVVGPDIVVSTPPVPGAGLVVAMLATFEVGAMFAFGERHRRDGAFVRPFPDEPDGWLLTTGPRFEPGTMSNELPAFLVHETKQGYAALVAAREAVAERLGIGDDDVILLAGGPPHPVDILLGLLAGGLQFGEPWTADVAIADAPTWRRMLSEGTTLPERIVCRVDALAQDLANALLRTGKPVFIRRDTHVSAAPIALAELVNARRTGPALPGVSRHLVDPTGAMVPDGTVGELRLAGPAVTQGQALTGQRYRRTRDGDLEFIGYVDARIPVGDHTVDPNRVEEFLNGLPEVAAAAVVPGEVGGEVRLIGWLQLVNADARAKEHEAATAAVRSRALATLAAHEVPVVFGILPELPRLPDGGIDRSTLVSMRDHALIGMVDDTPPRNQVERTVLKIFENLLPVRDFGVHADFFTLGGHSLLAAKVIGRVRDELGVLVPTRDFFARPTVAGLAEVIASVERAPADKTTALRGQLAQMTDEEVEQLLRQLS